MNNEIRSLTGKLKRELKDVYGSNLVGVFIFGSYSRNAQDAESDLDIAVVLRDYENYFDEIDRVGFFSSQLSLEYGISISKVFFKQEDWNSPSSFFTRCVSSEAVAA